jgi:adenylate kinase
VIIFTGVAGAGKSVQGKLLADTVGLPWLSTGEFLRMLISGERRKQMLAGQLLGDQEIIALVQKIFTVVDTKHEFILDGFPRTLPQADWLLAQAKHGQLDITAVIHLETTEEVVRRRLLERGRVDDTEDAIAERFQEYRTLTLPIVDEFREAGVPVYDVKAEGGVKQVHQAIVDKLKLPQAA